MKILNRFNRAREIAEEMLDPEATFYRWTPKTFAGWVVRIACTDVGVDAWQRAKNETPKD